MLPNPFKRFIELLEENGVKFLVVGGYAVSAHGYPRYTGDLDIFVAIDLESAAGIVKTFSPNISEDIRTGAKPPS